MNHACLLCQINTIPAIFEATQFSKSVLVLCEGDYERVCDFLPGLYFRIGSNEAIRECYQLLYAWNGGTHMAFANICNAIRRRESLFEAPPDGLLSKYGNLHHIAAMLVIKSMLCNEAQTLLLRIFILSYAAVHSASGFQAFRGHDLILTNITIFTKPPALWLATV